MPNIWLDPMRAVSSTGFRVLLAAGLFALLGLPLSAAAMPFAYVVNECAIDSHCHYGTVSVIDAANNTVTATIPVGNHSFAVAVSPDGHRVYVTNQCGDQPTCALPGTVSVIDTANNTLITSIALGPSPSGIAISPDGSRVYVASDCITLVNCDNTNDNIISVVDTATNAVVATIVVGMNVEGVTVSPDGKRVYVANWGDYTVSVIDTASDTVAATVHMSSSPWAIEVSPNGRWAYVTSACANTSCEYGTVSVIDTATNSIVAVIHVGPFAWGVAVSPDGKRVYVANNGPMDVIDTASNTVATTIPVEGIYPEDVAISPDGSRVYVTSLCVSIDSCNNGIISVIDMARESVVATVNVGVDPESLGAFVGPGALIAAPVSVTGNVGLQLSGSVPTLFNTTGCMMTDRVVRKPIRGSVAFDSATGAWTYTPTSATYSGPDAFTWQGVAPAGCAAADNPTNPVSNTTTVSLTFDPTIIGLGDVSIGTHDNTRESFTLAGSPPFTHKLTSSNVNVLPPSAMTVSPAVCGTDDAHLDCTLSLTAAAVSGKSMVTLTVTDAYGDTTKQNFSFTVNAGGGGGAFGLGLLGLLAVLVLLVQLPRRL